MKKLLNYIYINVSIEEIIILFINFIFFIKYSSRITNFYVLISLIVTLFYFLFFSYKKSIFKNVNITNKYIFILIIIYSLMCSILFYNINPSIVNVDRWSVITSFWDTFFKGDYVYLAKSNAGNYPGPMPFYFILALPFYLIGEIGFFSLTGFIMFYFLLRKTINNTTVIFFYLFILLCCPFYLHEIFSRSNVFLNGILIIWVMAYCLNTIKTQSKNLLVMSILIGLVLSTRNVFIIPFIVFFSYSLRNKKITFRQLLFIGTISTIVFSLTFVPFIYNHFKLFLIMNPFIIQSSALMPFSLTLIPIILSFITGFYIKNEIDVFKFSGYLLFLTIIIYYSYNIIIFGFNKAYFGSIADITYLNLCIPFLLFSCILKMKQLHNTL